MFVRFWISCSLLLSAGTARADHAHTVETGRSAFGAGVAVVAASFDTTLYSGNYEGIVPSLHWSNERFAAGTSVALYRLEKNGVGFYGTGDAVVHGQARIVGDHTARVGVVAAVSVPIRNNELRGMSMDHPMLMPALFGAYVIDRVELSATAGYSRAIGSSTDHDHGMWPLVEPMNMQELTWSAAGRYAITPAIETGARLSGGVPIGNGDHRLVGAILVGWKSRRLTTAAELQAGLAGDPFILRGVVSTTLTF
jgi:hypothetical protein